MKSITTLAVLVLVGIMGSILALNYYVNLRKPRSLAVEPSTALSKDTVQHIADVVTPVVTPPVTATPIIEKSSSKVVVPTHSTIVKPAATAPTTPKQDAHVPKIVPKSAEVAVTPSAKPVLPAKIAPKTVAPDAGLAAKGADAIVETGLTQGLHYVVIGSFADETNAKVAMRNYPLKNLSIHKDGKLYRLSAGAFATTADAKRRMNELQRQSVESILIQH